MTAGERPGEIAGVDAAKAALRRVVRARVAEIADELDAVSRAVVGHAAGSAEIATLLRTGRAMAYLAMPAEVSLDGLWAVPGVPPLAVPAADWRAGTMEAVVVDDPAGLVPGPRGLREPAPGARVVHPEDLALVFVPGLAFDAAGNRLGRGGGFYDRFLARAAGARRVGVCAAAQVVGAVPTLPHDVGVHMLLTEQGLRSVQAR